MPCCARTCRADPIASREALQNMQALLREARELPSVLIEAMSPCRATGAHRWLDAERVNIGVQTRTAPALPCQQAGLFEQLAGDFPCLSAEYGAVDALLSVGADEFPPCADRTRIGRE